MRRLKIEHLTTYQFGGPVALGPHRLHIRPREGHDVRIESSGLWISPEHDVRWHRDLYGNSVGTVSFRERTCHLEIRSEVVIQHFEENPLDFQLEDWAVTYPFTFPAEELVDLGPHQRPCFPGGTREFIEWVARFWNRGRSVSTFALLDGINRTIAKEFGYAERHAEGVQSPLETLQRRGGSCRDFATLFLETCRALGLPARFVSGYLCGSGMAGPGGGSTHAWSEVYLPGAGWRGFDSTSGELTGASHIAAAVSRHPAGVPPVSGSFTGELCHRPTLLVGVRTGVL